MTLKELRDNISRVLWLESPVSVPSYIWEDVTTAINSSLQLLYQSPDDYFRKEEVQFTFSAGTSELSVGAAYQEVVGPIWIPSEGNRELHQISDRSEFNQFFYRFYGKSESDAVSDGVPSPLCYFVKTRSGSESSGTDSSITAIMVSPAPTTDVAVKVILSKKPPKYSTSDIENLNGTEEIAIPGGMTETILLPLARWYAMRSHFFFEKDKIPMFESDAQRAMTSINATDPSMGSSSSLMKQIKKMDKNNQSQES
jgi:hypothetical protein